MSQFSKAYFRDTDIKDLINQYKQYECLWNINSPEYKNKSSKQRAWLEIAYYFQKEVSEVKRKIQYLRTAYVHEKKKVDASRKSGAKTPYKPSLFYYNELDFLDNMVIWRKFRNDLKPSDLSFEKIEISQDPEENEEFVHFENKEEDFLKEPEINCKTETFAETEQPLSPEPQRPISSFLKISHSQSLASQPGKRKLSAKIQLDDSLPINASASAINPKTKKLYISFGKTIALQLQQLPLEVAILAMSEIHTILTKKTLEHIRSLNNGHSSWNSESEDSFNELIEEACNDSN